MNEKKSAAYKKLVADMQKKYPVYAGHLSTKKVELFAPVLNGNIICKEINLYTYWQGFGYAKNTPKIKYLLVAQDWGNLFRRAPKDNQGFLDINKTGEYIAYNGIPTGNDTDSNLFRFFDILGYDLSKR